MTVQAARLKAMIDYGSRKKIPEDVKNELNIAPFYQMRLGDIYNEVVGQKDIEKALEIMEEIAYLKYLEYKKKFRKKLSFDRFFKHFYNNEIKKDTYAYSKEAKQAFYDKWKDYI